MAAAARARPPDLRAVIFSPIHRVASRALTTKLSWPMGVTTLASPSRMAAISAISPPIRQAPVTSECAHPAREKRGPPWLAHKASHEGIVCVERIAGHGEVRPLDVTNIPSCTYCRPQIASVGLSEEAAKGKGGEIRVGRFPYRANGKAIALGEPDGLVKTVFDGATGELLGAHIIGAEATELIQGFAIARTLEATEADLIATVFPHPTLSEAMGEAVLDAWGRALHV